MRKSLLCALCLLLATPAQADTTADYRSDSGIGIHFEISSAGDIRYSMASGGQAPPSYAIVHDGQVYNIVGGQAYRAEDFAAVMGELMGLRSPANAAALAQQPTIELIEQGVETVRGRTGRAYHMHLPSGATTSWSAFVMSDDTALAELGSGVARFYRLASGLTGDQFGGGPFFRLAQQVLAKGAPVRLLRNFELDTVDHSPISAERFAVPAAIGTREELRALVTARRSAVAPN